MSPASKRRRISAIRPTTKAAISPNISTLAPCSLALLTEHQPFVANPKPDDVARAELGAAVPRSLEQFRERRERLHVVDDVRPLFELAPIIAHRLALRRGYQAPFMQVRKRAQEQGAHGR